MELAASVATFRGAAMRIPCWLVLACAPALGLAACDPSAKTEPERPAPPSSSAGATTPPSAPPAAKTDSGGAGADHAQPISPEHEPTRKEQAEDMPQPGQANDHSSTARETVPSGSK
jgi:hypothetical protein